jgi:hypothetical protein
VQAALLHSPRAVPTIGLPGSKGSEISSIREDGLRLAWPARKAKFAAGLVVIAIAGGDRH